MIGNRSDTNRLSVATCNVRVSALCDSFVLWTTNPYHRLRPFLSATYAYTWMTCSLRRIALHQFLVLSVLSVNPRIQPQKGYMHLVTCTAFGPLVT